MTELVAGLLFAAGYPIAILVIARFRVVLRRRWVGMFVAHQVAMAGVATGWGLLGRPLGVALNAAWFVVALGWWLWSGRPGGGRPG